MNKVVANAAFGLTAAALLGLNVPLRALAATNSTLSPALTTVPAVQTLSQAMPAMEMDSLSQLFLNQNDEIVRFMLRSDQLTQNTQRKSQEYQDYVYPDLMQACNGRDHSACQEYQCRTYEWSLQVSLAVESSRYHFPEAIQRTGTNCGVIRYR